ncbi:MAG TPA: protein kinase, partial [Pirellulales bacterium]|nr:protein kinase [Pirellulales bacterium]
LIAALERTESSLAGDQAGSKARSRDTTVVVAGHEISPPAPERAAPSIAAPTVTPSGAETLAIERLGTCRLIRQIGRGGMGDVYQAHDESLDRRVAVKVLPPQLARDDDFVKRFRAEASAIARLVHANVVQVHSIGEDRGHHFFVMQFVDGESLAQRLRREHRLDVAVALRVFEHCLTGLAAAHDEGLIHRDIKPGNILLDAKSGRALLADFGLAKQIDRHEHFTATGMILGTVNYLSPEQGRGVAVDARSDLYSMGVLLYEMLSGTLPFVSESPTAMVFQHAYEPPRPLSQAAPWIPAELEQLVSRLLEKDPSDRYQTAQELLADVQALREGRPLPPRSEDRRKTEIRGVPRFDPEPAVAADVLSLARPNLWRRLEERAQSFVRRRTPEFVKQLQTTTQQVDGAIAEYSRRREKLAALLDEGRQVLAALSAQIDEELAAANARLQAATESEAEGLGSSADTGPGLQRLEALRNQRQQQQKAVADMELMVAKFDARLAQLRSQRDLLHARLQAVEAQLVLAGKRRTSHRVRPMQLLVAAGALGLAALMLFSQFRGRPAENDRPVAAPATPSPAAPLLGQPVVSVVESIHFLPQVNGRYRFLVKENQGICTEYQLTDDGRFERWGEFKLEGNPFLTDVSRDGRYLAAADTMGGIGIWELTEGRMVRHLVGHAQSVVVAIFSPDGERLISASTDGTLRLWQIGSATELKSQNVFLGSYSKTSITWSADGSRIAFRTTGPPQTRLQIYDADTLEPELTIGDFAADHLRFSPDGEQLFGLANSVFAVFDAKSGEQLRTFGNQFQSITISLDGRRLLGHNIMGESLWDIESGQFIEQLPGPQGSISKAAISDDGRWVSAFIIGSGIHVWELPQAAVAAGLQTFGVASPVYCAAFSPDGFITAWSLDGQIDLWDTQRPASQLTLFKQPIRVTALAFSADGQRLAYGTGQVNRAENEVHVREVGGLPASQYDPGFQDYRWRGGHAGLISGVVWLKDGKHVVTGGRDGKLRLWELFVEESLKTIEVGLPINSMALAHDSQRLLVGGDDSSMRMVDLQAGVEIRRFEGHTHFVNAVAISADQSRVAAGGADRTVRVWNTESAELVATLTGHSGRVNAVALSANGAELVSGSDDATVRLWSVNDATESLRLTEHYGPVRTLALSWDGGHLLTAGDDGTVRFWDLRTLKQKSKDEEKP